jgi:hypothetical protein
MFDEHVYTEIRRFLVIRAFSHHSLCVPIATYRAHGTRYRPDAQHHSIAYTGSTPPFPLSGENMVRHPIRIKPRSSEKFHKASRINFSKIYTIEHNVKVKNIGKVDDEYMPLIMQYIKESTGIGEPKLNQSHVDTGTKISASHPPEGTTESGLWSNPSSDWTEK